MSFKQIKHKKLYEEVADQIKKLIDSGELKPGDKLPSVNSLAESFQVGRSAIREALSALHAMGFIDLRQGEGTFVKFTSKDIFKEKYVSILLKDTQIESLLEVRKIIESACSELAAERRDEDDLHKLSESLELMRTNLDNVTRGNDADWLFHYNIAKATKNSLLIEIIETISESVKENLKANREILFSLEKIPEKLLEEHEEIYKAILNKDSKLAKELTYNHLHQVEILINKINEANEAE